MYDPSHTYIIVTYKDYNHDSPIRVNYFNDLMHLYPPNAKPGKPGEYGASNNL